MRDMVTMPTRFSKIQQKRQKPSHLLTEAQRTQENPEKF